MAILDRFSPEEIRQIKEELLEYGKGRGKGVATEKPYHELRDLYRLGKYSIDEQMLEDVTNISDISNSINLIVDTALHNLEYRHRKSDGRTYLVTKRIATIHRRVDPEEYAEMYQEIVDVVKKHFKYVSKKDAEVIGRQEGTIK